MSDDFGEAVREAREQKGWSQEFLAARVGTTQSTIDRIESGLTRRSRVLPEIAAALDLELAGVTKASAVSNRPSGLTRVTYVLPSELVARIEEYKIDSGIPSDDEAVRRLIDDALKHRDDFVSITDRLVQKLKQLKSLREAAGFVLANHPLVKSISFNGEKIVFVTNDNFSVEIGSRGVATIVNEEGNYYKFRDGKAPGWASSLNLREPYKLDDDIPF